MPLHQRASLHSNSMLLEEVMQNRFIWNFFPYKGFWKNRTHWRRGCFTYRGNFFLRLHFKTYCSTYLPPPQERRQNIEHWLMFLPAGSLEWMPMWNLWRENDVLWLKQRVKNKSNKLLILKPHSKCNQEGVCRNLEFMYMHMMKGKNIFPKWKFLVQPAFLSRSVNLGIKMSVSGVLCSCWGSKAT